MVGSKCLYLYCSIRNSDIRKNVCRIGFCAAGKNDRLDDPIDRRKCGERSKIIK